MLSTSQIRDLQTAVAHQQAGRWSEAIKVYSRLIRKAPDNFQCIFSLALLHAQQGNLSAAVPLFRRAASIRPDHPDVQYNLAVALSMIGSHIEAAQQYSRVLQRQPGHIAARNNYAATLLQCGRLKEALQQYDELLALNPALANAHNNRGMALQRLMRFEEALDSYDKAVELQPRFPEAYVNRGNALSNLTRVDEALVSLDRAKALNPNSADAYRNIGNIQSAKGNFGLAIAAYDSALALQPNDSEAKSMRLNAKMNVCDWRDLDSESKELLSSARHGSPIYPFVALAMPSSLDDQLRCARAFTKATFPTSAEPFWRGEIYSHDRIRIAYLSGDFREHAVAHLLAGVFERHDRSRFDITGISFGADRASPLRRRIEAAFERFIDVHVKTDREIAALVRDLEIDIAIDLMGYTQNARTGILANRPAPIQVSYLGFLGSMGADFVDYIVGDKIALPLDRQPFFTERIVHLPDCFLATDDALEIAPDTPSRVDVGLPAEGFVFCSFNASYKTTRLIFDIWMRLLRAVEGSVLWLAGTNEEAAANLRHEAQHNSVDPSRLIFAPMLPLAEHMARQRLADLFLDTAPYNAGATAAAALWAGVPVLTLMGTTFVGRMAASMLHAVGLPELATESLASYEALGLRIAADGSYCESLKAKLAHNRKTHALFDTAGFTRHIENAYFDMWRAYQAATPRSSP